MGKRMVILGLARQGKALARFAVGAGARVVVSDLRTSQELGPNVAELADLPIDLVLGDHPMRLLEDIDVLAVSGGVPADAPLVQAARDRGVAITNDSLEFLRRVPAPVIGITGSAGKTTTTALTGEMVRASGRRTWVGGNIGRPLIADLAEIGPDDLVVQELSSFQLEFWTESPAVAAVLNLTPNHLDRHRTMAAYREAKANILRFQRPHDVAVLSADDPGARGLEREVRGRLRWFSLKEQVKDGVFVDKGRMVLRDGIRETTVCRVDEIRLRGRHNVLNALAAIALSDAANTPVGAMRETITSFTGVEHRLEHVGTIRSVQYINDSIATAPERVVAALDSFTEPLILLAGGRDKEMVWDVWARKVVERVKAVVLFGELADLMAAKLHQVQAEGRLAGQPVIARVGTLADAVDQAASLAEAGDVVLLAPGGTSFDSFADFAARGQAFKQYVKDLAA